MNNMKSKRKIKRELRYRFNVVRQYTYIYRRVRLYLSIQLSLDLSLFDFILFIIVIRIYSEYVLIISIIVDLILFHVFMLILFPLYLC
jgi:hypothetical protein